MTLIAVMMLVITGTSLSRKCNYEILNSMRFRNRWHIPQVKSGVEMPWDEQSIWRTDLYVSSGVLGLGILSLLAITSLPSVGNILTWREFIFIQVGNTNLSKHTHHIKQAIKDLRL